MNNARRVALAVVFAFDPDVSQRVKNALQPEAQVCVVRNEGDCLHSVDRVRGALVLLELSPQTDMPVRRILWALRGRDATLRVFGYLAPKQESALAMMEAVRRGLDGLIFRAPDDTTALRNAVGNQRFAFAGGVEYILGTVNPLIPAGLHALVRQVFESVVPFDTVRALAAHLRMSPRALAKILKCLGGPTPELFRSWTILLWAAYALQTTPWSIERIARELHLRSSSALSHLMQRRVGVTPKDLRRQDALLTVGRAFRRVRSRSPRNSPT